uniref:Uncharacterized protein n=1 Tax=Aegilops tauschii subsp. strangulata TaxID=200361 RepID=A0A453HDE8_AEGTS
ISHPTLLRSGSLSLIVAPMLVDLAAAVKPPALRLRCFIPYLPPLIHLVPSASPLRQLASRRRTDTCGSHCCRGERCSEAAGAASGAAMVHGRADGGAAVKLAAVVGVLRRSIATPAVALQ